MSGRFADAFAGFEGFLWEFSDLWSHVRKHTSPDDYRALREELGACAELETWECLDRLASLGIPRRGLWGGERPGDSGPGFFYGPADWARQMSEILAAKTHSGANRKGYNTPKWNKLTAVSPKYQRDLLKLRGIESPEVSERTNAALLHLADEVEALRQSMQRLERATKDGPSNRHRLGWINSLGPLTYGQGERVIELLAEILQRLDANSTAETPPPERDEG